MRLMASDRGERKQAGFRLGNGRACGSIGTVLKTLRQRRLSGWPCLLALALLLLAPLCHACPRLPDPLDHATQTQFTVRGEAEASIFADDAYLFRLFDNAGRMTLLQNRLGAQWLFGYDDAGHGTVTQSPLGRQWAGNGGQSATA